MTNEPEDDLPPDDPNAPLPRNAPFYVRAFYNEIQELVDGTPEPDEREALAAIWDWMQANIPERFLRPKG